jgi:hypothetical protein
MVSQAVDRNPLPPKVVATYYLKGSRRVLKNYLKYSIIQAQFRKISNI